MRFDDLSDSLHRHRPHSNGMAREGDLLGSPFAEPSTVSAIPMPPANGVLAQEGPGEYLRRGRGPARRRVAVGSTGRRLGVRGSTGVSFNLRRKKVLMNRISLS